MEPTSLWNSTSHTYTVWYQQHTFENLMVNNLHIKIIDYMQFSMHVHEYTCIFNSISCTCMWQVVAI